MAFKQAHRSLHRGVLFPCMMMESYEMLFHITGPQSRETALPDSNKPLPDPMLINCQWGLGALFTAILQEMLQIYPWYEFEND